MPPPREIADLVERFEQHGDSYRSGVYNEAQLRQEFVDPMFKALGWDMDNISGYAEAYKDVIHEDAIKIGGATKAPDYCFRIGGTRKFFLEAKKPSIDIKNDAHPAFQLRRYAWSAKLPLSVLTDFEEFAVYDCRVKPAQDDNAAFARVLYFNLQDYSSRWEESQRFSRAMPSSKVRSTSSPNRTRPGVAPPK
ncbi:MAG: type I restriction enzyme HsdR N-terminal domain-containing protein [Verrucomicrobiota bacterium]